PVSEGNRQRGQPVAHRRPDSDREVLGRGRTRRLEPDRKHRHPPERAGCGGGPAGQTGTGKFGAEGAPAGWNRIANTVIQQNGLDAWKAARILALVNFAVADSFIGSFAPKEGVRFWGPVAAIRRADEDGNPLTDADADWKP